MKKILALSVSLLLILTLFASCGQFKFDGTWVTEMDMSEFIGDDVDIKLNYYITFDGDNCTMEFNEDEYLDAMYDYAEQLLAEEGLSLEEALELQGMSKDEFDDALLSELDETSVSGTWTYENDILTINDEEFEVEIIDKQQIKLTDGDDQSMTFNKK